MPYQAITAGSVPFDQDFRTQNKIKFRIDDAARNTGESEECTVRRCSRPDIAGNIVSNTSGRGVGATGKQKCLSGGCTYVRMTECYEK